MEVSGILQSPDCFNVEQQTPVRTERDAGWLPTYCLDVSEKRIDYLCEVILFWSSVKWSEVMVKFLGQKYEYHVH